MSRTNVALLAAAGPAEARRTIAASPRLAATWRTFPRATMQIAAFCIPPLQRPRRSWSCGGGRSADDRLAARIRAVGPVGLALLLGGGSRGAQPSHFVGRRERLLPLGQRLALLLQRLEAVLLRLLLGPLFLSSGVAAGGLLALRRHLGRALLRMIGALSGLALALLRPLSGGRSLALGLDLRVAHLGVGFASQVIRLLPQVLSLVSPVGRLAAALRFVDQLVVSEEGPREPTSRRIHAVHSPSEPLAPCGSSHDEQQPVRRNPGNRYGAAEHRAGNRASSHRSSSFSSAAALASSRRACCSSRAAFSSLLSASASARSSRSSAIAFSLRSAAFALLTSWLALSTARRSASSRSRSAASASRRFSTSASSSSRSRRVSAFSRSSWASCSACSASRRSFRASCAASTLLSCRRPSRARSSLPDASPATSFALPTVLPTRPPMVRSEVSGSVIFLAFRVRGPSSGRRGLDS